MLLKLLLLRFFTLNLRKLFFSFFLQPPLVKAIFLGDINEVHHLLSTNPDVNIQDEEKRSPLHAASFKGDMRITELLLQHGARVNTKDSKWLTPLHRACRTGNKVLFNPGLP